jgi:hypothetical protein
MEMMKMEMEVPKETAELGIALGKLLMAIKMAMKDGLTIADLPVAMATLMSPEVAAGMMGVEKVAEELKEGKMDAIVALGAGLAKGLSN